MHWEVVVHAGPSCQDVVFVYANCLFQGVGPVVMQWGKLYINDALLEESFELFWVFIVHLMIFGFAAAICESLVNAG